MYIYIYIYIYTHVWSHTALLGDMATATTRVFAQALIFRSSRHTASSILLLMRLGFPHRLDLAPLPCHAATLHVTSARHVMLRLGISVRKHIAYPIKFMCS